LTPTMNGSACSTEIQKASEVCPDRLRPLLSIAVNEIQSVQRVEDGLDQEQVDSAVAQGGDLLLVRLADPIEGDSAVGGVFDPGGEREGDVQRAERARDEARLLGGLPRPAICRCPRESRALEAHLGGGVLQRVVRLPDARGREGVRRREVRAGLEVRVVDLGDDLRVGQVQEVGITLDVARVVAKALAAVLLLREPTPVDEDTPRPVEHENPLGEKLLQLSSYVSHENGSRAQRGREPLRLSRLFRRFFDWSPSCHKAVQVLLG
jgi:hypothetical protein